MKCVIAEDEALLRDVDVLQRVEHLVKRARERREQHDASHAVADDVGVVDRKLLDRHQRG